MWTAIINFVTANHVAIGAALVTLWHWVSSTTQAKAAALVADRVKEAAFAAWNTVRLAAGIHVDVQALEQQVIAKTLAALGRLGIPITDELRALVQHELDQLAGELAAQQLQQQLADVDAGTAAVVAEFERARARGAARFADLDGTPAVPPDAPSAPEPTPTTAPASAP